MVSGTVRPVDAHDQWAHMTVEAVQEHCLSMPETLCREASDCPRAVSAAEGLERTFVFTCHWLQNFRAGSPKIVAKLRENRPWFPCRTNPLHKTGYEISCTNTFATPWRNLRRAFILTVLGLQTLHDILLR